MLLKKKTPLPKTREELRIEAYELAEIWSGEGVEADAICARLEEAELGGLVDRAEAFHLVKESRKTGSIHNNFIVYRLIQLVGLIGILSGVVALLTPILTGLGLPGFQLALLCVFVIISGYYLIRSPEAEEPPG